MNTQGHKVIGTWDARWDGSAWRPDYLPWRCMTCAE